MVASERSDGFVPIPNTDYILWVHDIDEKIKRETRTAEFLVSWRDPYRFSITSIADIGLVTYQGFILGKK